MHRGSNVPPTVLAMRHFVPLACAILPQALHNDAISSVHVLAGAHGYDEYDG